MAAPRAGSRTALTDGPFFGAYLQIPTTILAGNPVTPGATTYTLRVPVPQDFRVSQIDVACNSSSGGASRPTVQVTDGTNNLLSASVTAISGGIVAVTPTSTPSLVAAQRNRVKGDILQVSATFVAAETTTGLVVTISGFTKGHVVASAARPDEFKND